MSDPMIARMFRRSDFVIGVVLLGLGGLATWLALQIGAGPLQRTLPPSTVPLICSIGIALCGLALSARAIVSGSPDIQKPIDLQQLSVAVLIGGFFVSFPYVDFRLSTLLFTATVMLVLGCRSLVQLLLVPLATAGGIWLLFGHLFQVYLPTWI